MKPGDFIEWTYSSGEIVPSHERITYLRVDLHMTSIMNPVTVVGKLNMLIGLHEDKMTWLSDRGVNTMPIVNMVSSQLNLTGVAYVKPRQCNLLHF